MPDEARITDARALVTINELVAFVRTACTRNPLAGDADFAKRIFACALHEDAFVLSAKVPFLSITFAGSSVEPSQSLSSVEQMVRDRYQLTIISSRAKDNTAAPGGGTVERLMAVRNHLIWVLLTTKIGARYYPIQCGDTSLLVNGDRVCGLVLYIEIPYYLRDCDAAQGAFDDLNTVLLKPVAPAPVDPEAEPTTIYP